MALIQTEAGQNHNSESPHLECEILKRKKIQSWFNNIIIRSQPTASKQRIHHACQSKLLLSARWFCGDWHYSHSCRYKKRKYLLCHKRGHTENFYHLSEAKSSDSTSKSV